MSKIKIKKGDQVKVVSGKEAGKTGKVHACRHRDAAVSCSSGST